MARREASAFGKYCVGVGVMHFFTIRQSAKKSQIESGFLRIALFGFSSTFRKVNLRIFKILKSLKQKQAVAPICLFVIILLGVLVHVLPTFWNYKTDQLGKEEDIYYLWIEGKRILSGENPYARILLSNMRDNQKYATYFPLFYIMSYLTQLLG
ncbi:MAG: hypothetical protein PUP92_36330, partial [Rhizonema sp. PD38]|nr:hypothetical protein [Rhizonema sp. PD38]